MKAWTPALGVRARSWRGRDQESAEYRLGAGRADEYQFSRYRARRRPKPRASPCKASAKMGLLGVDARHDTWGTPYYWLAYERRRSPHDARHGSVGDLQWPHLDHAAEHEPDARRDALAPAGHLRHDLMRARGPHRGRLGHDVVPGSAAVGATAPSSTRATVAPAFWPCRTVRLRRPCRRFLASWLTAAQPTPIILSGMIGSRQGWREAALCALPGRPRRCRRAPHLDRQCQPSAGSRWCPALTTTQRGMPDVMRGEETQIFGALGTGSGLCVLPGTHSKWATVEGGTHCRLSLVHDGRGVRGAERSHHPRAPDDAVDAVR